MEKITRPQIFRKEPRNSSKHPSTETAVTKMIILIVGLLKIKRVVSDQRSSDPGLERSYHEHGESQGTAARLH